MDGFVAQELVSTAWAFATAGWSNASFYVALACSISRTMLRLGHDRDGLVDPKGVASALPAAADTKPDPQAFDDSAKCGQPYVLAEGPHWFALYKPPLWEVGVSVRPIATVNPFEDDTRVGVDDEQIREKETP